MLSQIATGSLLILATTTIAGLAWFVLEAALIRLHDWSAAPPHAVKLVTLLLITVLLALAMITAAVWIWAIALDLLGVFVTFEASMYFTLVAFTTLGFGDLLLPQDWRLLAGFCATNGWLLFGVLTAMLVETLRETRLRQRNRRH